MYGDTLPFDTRLQRASGEVRVTIGSRASGPHLKRLYQKGAGKARLPRTYDSRHCEVVLINTAGGITGGDRFDVEVCAEDGANVVVTTQACERLYRSLGSDGTVSNRLTAGEGAALTWVPQETIFFDGGALCRTLDLDAGRGAQALVLEPVLFGRTAMGETVSQGRFRERWRVRVDGRLAYAENTLLCGDIDTSLARVGVGNGGLAYLSGVVVGTALDELRDKVRRDVSADGVEAALSLVRGVLVVRAVAATGEGLRRWIESFYWTYAGSALPRAWYC